MKKFVKFYMRDKRLNATFSLEQAERIIDHPAQLVKITDERGNWTGQTLNKADLIGTDRDHDREKDENYNRVQIPEPEHKIFDTNIFKPPLMRSNERIEP